MGVVEDIIAVRFSTDEEITLRVIGIVFLVALPFAVISEYIVDHPRFWKTILRIKENGEGVESKNNTR